MFLVFGLVALSLPLGAADTPPPNPEEPFPPATEKSLVPGVVTPLIYYFPVVSRNAADTDMPRLLSVAGTPGLESGHSGATLAIVAIQDFSRDAVEPFTLLTKLAGDNNASTVVMVPRFFIDADVMRLSGQLPEGGVRIARWALDGWEYGNDSLSDPPRLSVSSFAALDLLMMYLGERQFFPDLRRIVVVGHGAGGDFVQRYAATTQTPNILGKQGIAMRFVVANASSYLYFTAPRLMMNQDNGRTGFVTPDIAQCPTYNAWPYGLAQLNDYARHTGANVIALSYATRSMIYLTGEQVAQNDPMPDNNCAAVLEGPDRATRAMNYSAYLGVVFNSALRRSQQFVTVPGAGYDPSAMFGSPCGMAALFGDGNCASNP